MVDTIIAGNGIYPGDESMPIVKIVEYQNAFDGGTAYGLIYKGESLDRYAETPFVNNPKTIWEHDSVKTEKPKITLDELVRRADEDGVGICSDGCEVEVDGYCEHGKPSLLMQFGLV
jgi:hypothetical protein